MTDKKKGKIKTKTNFLLEEISPFLIDVEIVADEQDFIPEYKTEEAVCVDLIANVQPDAVGRRVLTIPYRKIQEIDCGFSMAIPDGYKAEIAIRSGHGKKGLIVVNSPGQIDSDYTGRIKV